MLVVIKQMLSYIFKPLPKYLWYCSHKLKEHMQYCVDHPDEVNQLAKVQAQVSEVKGVMIENIEKVKMFPAFSGHRLFMLLDLIIIIMFIIRFSTEGRRLNCLLTKLRISGHRLVLCWVCPCSMFQLQVICIV